MLLRDAAYERLESAIVDGMLRPGERLRDTSLSAWLGVSRTPIREALARLADIGLVETAANRYTRVAVVSREDARLGFPIAAALHALVAELAVPRLAAPDLADLRAEHDRFTWAVWRAEPEPAAAADRSFHAVLARAAGNEQLDGLMERVMPRLWRLERLTWPVGGERPGAQQHEALMSAAAATDTAAAVRAARAEWLAVGDAVEQSLARGVVAP